MGNIVPGNNKNSEGTGTNGNSGEHSSPPAKDDSNKPKMGARRYSQEREQNKLRCTLKNASKQGDRPINPPKRYTAEDYENTRRSTPRRPNVRRGIAKKNAKGGYSGKKETRAAAVGRGKDGSFMNEVDIPTSPMLMRECEQIGVETPRDQNESLPTPCHKGNGVNVLIRTQAAEPSDVRGRRASAGQQYASSPPSILGTPRGAAQAHIFGCRRLDENVNASAFVLPTPTEANQNPFLHMSDPMRASVWGQYRQMANSLGTASLDNASLMSSYNQHQQAMSAVMTGSMVPPSMTSYGSQFPLMHWNPLNPYSNIEQALANANGIAGCPGCMKKAVEELSDHFVNAFLAGITNKFRNCSSHHICNTPTANGGGSSQSDSSVTIPALSNPNHEHLEINTPIVPNNLPKPQPTFRPYI